MNTTDEGPIGQALIDFAQTVADALDGEWTVEWNRNDDEHPDYWPTRVTLANDENEHGWHLRINGTNPATTGRVTVSPCDRYPAAFHDAIDWDSAPAESKSITVSVDRRGGPAAVARDIGARLLTDDAEDRQAWLRSEIQRVARDQTRADAAYARLVWLAAAPYEALQEELMQWFRSPAGPLAARTTLTGDRSKQQGRARGVELHVKGPDAVTVTVTNTTVSLRSAAMIARIISGDTRPADDH